MPARCNPLIVHQSKDQLRVSLTKLVSTSCGVFQSSHKNYTENPVARKLRCLNNNLKSLDNKDKNLLSQSQKQAANQLFEMQEQLMDKKFLGIMYSRFEYLNEYLRLAWQMEKLLEELTTKLSEKMTKTRSYVDYLFNRSLHSVDYVKARGTSCQKKVAISDYKRIQAKTAELVIKVEGIQNQLTEFYSNINEFFLHTANDKEKYENMLGELNDPKYKSELAVWSKGKLKKNCRSTQANQSSTIDGLEVLLRNISLKDNGSELLQAPQASQGF